jgi:hypothetical protein
MSERQALLTDDYEVEASVTEVRMYHELNNGYYGAHLHRHME